MALPLGMSAVDSGMVLVLITIVVLPIAAFAFARSGAVWDSLGKGRYAIDQELPPRRSVEPPPPVDRAVQATEARQMLEAKAYLHLRRGEAPVDVEAELERLLESELAAPPDRDDELRAEVRHLVVARNERRLRRGQPPLDVEAETERELSNLVGSD
jgi:hypothetical protein